MNVKADTKAWAASFRPLQDMLRAVRGQGAGNIIGSPKTLKAVNAALGLLLILAALFLARDAISIWSSPREKPSVDAGEKAGKAAARSLKDYAPILAKNPFGFQAGELKPLLGRPGSPTDAFLMGTISGQGDKDFAIFMDKKGVQDVFRVGDPVYGMGALARVEKDSAFITSSGGSFIEVPMEEGVFKKDARKTSPDGAEAASEAGRGALARKVSEGAYAIDKARFQNALENMQDIMTDARLTPYIVDGKQSGFIVNDMKSNGVFQSMGLQNGDTLLRVNDFNISSMETALQAFNALKGVDRVNLNMIRNGSKTTMTYQIK